MIGRRLLRGRRPFRVSLVTALSYYALLSLCATMKVLPRNNDNMRNSETGPVEYSASTTISPLYAAAAPCVRELKIFRRGKTTTHAAV